MRSDYIPTHPSGPEYNAMEKLRTQITHTHTPLHGLGAGFFVPNGSVLLGLGTHLKGILSPMVSSKYPFWHWKLHSVLSLILVFGSSMAWISTSLVDCGVPVLQSPASILRLLISSVVAVHVCAAEHGQKIVK